MKSNCNISGEDLAIIYMLLKKYELIPYLLLDRSTKKAMMAINFRKFKEDYRPSIAVTADRDIKFDWNSGDLYKMTILPDKDCGVLTVRNYDYQLIALKIKSLSMSLQFEYDDKGNLEEIWSGENIRITSSGNKDDIKSSDKIMWSRTTKSTNGVKNISFDLYKEDGINPTPPDVVIMKKNKFWYEMYINDIIYRFILPSEMGSINRMLLKTSFNIYHNDIAMSRPLE